MDNLEIERKFLLDKFPDSLPLLESAEVWQGYISTAPVVRIRKKVTADGESYRLCFKGEGGLVRTEVEMPLPAEKYEALLPLLGAAPVHKVFRVYALPSGERLECSLVDGQYYYAEVEFPTEEAALAWDPGEWQPWLLREVTQEGQESMAAYWARTRG